MAVLFDLSDPNADGVDLGVSTTLGRAPTCSIKLKDRLASRSHAEIQRTPEGRYLLVDLGSTHGTYVAGKKVIEHLLSDDDEIIIGTNRLRFRDDAAAGPDADNVSITVEAAEPYVQERITFETIEHFPAVEQVDNEQDLFRNYEKLRAAYELSRVVGSEQDMDTLLEKILDAVFSLLSADRAAILLVDPATGVPTPRLAKRLKGGATKIVLSKTIINEVTATKAGLILTDAGIDTRFGGAQSIISEGVRSAMCVPMLHGAELMGVMHMDSLVATNVFGEKDLELFTSIARQAALTIKNAFLRDRIRDETKSRLQFQRFLAPSLVDQLISGKMSLGKEGELREVTVLFVDIRGFTRMSEKMMPADVMHLLNVYFEIMVEVLFRHDGTFDKYIGDELMALFGAPVSMENAPLSAIRCALDMKQALARLNVQLEKSGRQAIQIGIGIHTGEALCGILGSYKTMQYTAIGDTVNTGARLCSACQPMHILVSEQTMDRVRDQVIAEALPAITVKGKRQALTVFNVTGCLSATEPNTKT